jgi:hypothetical protein
MKPFATAIAATLLLAATPAFAQAPLNFADVDTDASGELSYAELQAVWPDLTEDEFNTADLDGNGSLSIDELNGLQPSTLSEPLPLGGGTTEPAAPDDGSSSSLIESPKSD